jgi:hypothetical protein
VDSAQGVHPDDLVGRVELLGGRLASHPAADEPAPCVMVLNSGH